MLSILSIVLGASVGSFLNVVADRVPAGRSLVTPRSYCDSCRRPLSSRDMFPVISFLWLRGRCRYCRAAIPVRTIWVELVTGVLFLALYLKYGFGIEFVVLGGAVSLLIVIAVIDLDHGLILNRMVYPATAILLLLAPFWPVFGISRPFMGSSGMLESLISSLIAGAGAFLFFLIIMMAYPRGMGAGDVKLAGVLGLLVGFPAVLGAVWIAAVSGGIVAILLLLLRKKGRKDAIPFGPFLSLGAITVLLIGAEFLSLYEGVSTTVASLWT